MRTYCSWVAVEVHVFAIVRIAAGGTEGGEIVLERSRIVTIRVIRICPKLSAVLLRSQRTSTNQANRI